MSMLVHIADARDEASIRRAGIRAALGAGTRGEGVYLMPVLPNYFVSHQWLRELKRRGARTMIAVYVRIPDDEPVYVGHYNSEPLLMTASGAAGLVMHAPDARGYELFVPRKIGASEVHAVRGVNDVVGWRYHPDAHGRPPCGCPVCNPKGQIRSRKLRDAYESSFEHESGEDVEDTSSDENDD